MHNPPTTEPKPQPASRQAGAFFGGGATPFFQPKLTVNQPGDAYEQEADHIADKVLRMRKGDAPVVQRMFAPAVQRACAHCEEKRREEEGVQRKETNPSPALPNVGGSISGDAGGQSAPAIVSDVLSSGGGQAMDANTQDFMSSRMGADFSNVRIHTDGKAAESASAIQARAYTSGNNIVFGQGEYQPGTDEGKRLLAHELVHVGQQGGDGINRRHVQRKTGDKRIEILEPLDDVKDSIDMLEWQENLVGYFGKLNQVLVIQGNLAVFYSVSKQGVDVETKKLGAYSIKHPNIPPTYWLTTPDGKFKFLGYQITELNNGDTSDSEIGLVGAPKDLPTDKRQIIDKEMSLNEWFSTEKGREDFYSKLTTSGFGIIILPSGKGGSKASSSHGQQSTPRRPEWMKAFQEAMKKRILEQREKEPQATDLPDNFYFYYSKQFNKFRATAPGKHPETHKEIRAYLDVEEKMTLDETLEIVRTKLRLKALAAFNSSTPNENLQQIPLKDQEIWALELLLNIRKRIAEEMFGRSDQFDLPDAVFLSNGTEETAGDIFLGISVRANNTEIITRDPNKELTAEEMVNDSPVKNVSTQSTARLGDPLRKGMTVENIWPVLKQATRELRLGRDRAINPDQEATKFDKVKSAYPAELIPVDLREDGIAVKNGVGKYRMKIDYQRFEGDVLLDLTLANMKTVFFRWQALPMNMFLSESEQKIVAGKNEWLEKRALLQDLFRYKTFRNNSAFASLTHYYSDILKQKLSEGVSPLEIIQMDAGFMDKWQRDPVGNAKMPDQEGDYIIYCEAFFPAANGVFRMPSEAFFPVRVVDGYKLAQKSIEQPDLDLAALEKQLAEARANQESEDKIHRLETQIEALKTAKSSSLVSNTERSLSQTDEALELAEIIQSELKNYEGQNWAKDVNDNFLKTLLGKKKNGKDIGHKLIELWVQIIMSDRRENALLSEKVSWAVEKIKTQRDSLKGVLNRAAEFKDEIREPAYTPKVAFVSETTGQVYNLLMILAESNERSDYYKTKKVGPRNDYDIIEEEIPNRTVMSLIDVTTEQTQRRYKGYSSNPDKHKGREEATREAIQAFGDKAAYGVGYVRFSIPGLMDEGINIKSTPSTWEKVKQTLAIVATIAGVVALAVGTVASGGALGAAAIALGIGAGAIGAGLAISNIADRLDNHTFEYDVDFALDLMNVVGFFTSISRLAAMSRLAKAADNAADLAQLANVAKAIVRLEKGFLIYQRAETGMNFVLTSYKVIKDLDALNEAQGLTSEQKNAIRNSILGNALLSHMTIAMSVKDSLNPSPTLAHEMSRLLAMKASQGKYFALNHELGLTDKQGNWLIPEVAAAVEAQKLKLENTDPDTLPGNPVIDLNALSQPIADTSANTGVHQTGIHGSGGGGSKPPKMPGGSGKGGGGRRGPRKPKLDADSADTIKALDEKIAELKKRSAGGDKTAEAYISILEVSKGDIRRNPGPETIANAREHLADLDTAISSFAGQASLDKQFKGIKRQLEAGHEKVLTEFLQQAGSWKDAVSFLQSQGRDGVKALEKLRAFRVDIIRNLADKYDQQAKELPGASDKPESDKDINFSGNNAGANLIAAEVWMETTYGKNWEQHFRMNFYTDKERLLMFGSEPGKMSAQQKSATQTELDNLTLQFNLARMMRHAKDNPGSSTRIDKLMGDIGVALDPKFTDYVTMPKEKMKALRDELLLEVDAKMRQYKSADTPAEDQPGIAAEITRKQIEINFLSNEAYISPGALRMVSDPNAVLSPQESRLAVISNIEMMEEIIGLAGGNIEIAARQYELYKYMARASKAMQHEQKDLFYDALNKELGSTNREATSQLTNAQVLQHYSDFMAYAVKFLKSAPQSNHAASSTDSSGGGHAGSSSDSSSGVSITGPSQLHLNFDAPAQQYGVSGGITQQPIGPNDVIVDTNVLISFEHHEQGKANQAETFNVDSLKGYSLVSTRTAFQEASEKGASPQSIKREIRLIPNINETEKRQILDTLIAHKVGGSKGLADSLIVRQAFYAATTDGAPAKYATADQKIINALARIANLPVDNLKGYPNVASYVSNELNAQGFLVTIGSRSLFVIPVQPVSKPK